MIKTCFSPKISKVDIKKLQDMKNATLYNSYKRAIFWKWYNTLELVCKPHCKPGPFDKQFCMANTAIFTSYITFQNNHNEIFTQGKCEFMNSLFALSDKMKILIL